MRQSNYNKLPSTKINGYIDKGWDAISAAIQRNINRNKYIISIDTYVGVHIDEIEAAVKGWGAILAIKTADLFKSEPEILAMTQQFITDDVLFGRRTELQMSDYFDAEKLQQAQQKIEKHDGLIVILGCGAAAVSPKTDTLVYIDMARWEIQMRFRAHSVVALGVDNSSEAVSLQYKRGYFNDWQVCDKHKRTLYNKVDYWIDTHTPNKPKMIDGATFLNGLKATVNAPFRVAPFFDPAPWGGQWMKGVCGLSPEKANYGWCFDCVPEENSLLLNVDGELFEMPSINLVFTHAEQLLGKTIIDRFGAEFPIRFDFLDTVQGGNLSLQVHPTDQYIKDTFSMPYTQDESYYLLDAEPGAEVYLGLKTGIDKDQMISDLRSAARGEMVFDAEKYVNKFAAKKHDHYLIPGGTIHCSGSQALVLEISSTPNLFTFKLWDWQRLGLDGKPRPINVEHGKNVINWDADTQYTLKYLVNATTPIASGDGWKEEATGLHEREFIETRRHWFSKTVEHNTNGNLHVLNLVQGEQAIIKSPDNAFEPFVVHYAETFIIPAHLGRYTITPYNQTQCGTIKAYVRS